MSIKVHIEERMNIHTDAHWGSKSAHENTHTSIKVHIEERTNIHTDMSAHIYMGVNINVHRSLKSTHKRTQKH